MATAARYSGGDFRRCRHVSDAAQANRYTVTVRDISESLRRLRRRSRRTDPQTGGSQGSISHHKFIGAIFLAVGRWSNGYRLLTIQNRSSRNYVLSVSCFSDVKVGGDLEGNFGIAEVALGDVHALRER